MQLHLDDNNVIIGYASFGEIKNGVEFDENKVPDDFYDKFKPTFFMLKDSEIVENSDYVAPSSSVPTGPSDVQNIVIQQAVKMAQMQKIIIQQSQDIAKLKGANS